MHSVLTSIATLRRTQTTTGHNIIISDSVHHHLASNTHEKSLDNNTPGALYTSLRLALVGVSVSDVVRVEGGLSPLPPLVLVGRVDETDGRTGGLGHRDRHRSEAVAGEGLCV